MHITPQQRATSARPVINRTAQLSGTGRIADDCHQMPLYLRTATRLRLEEAARYLDPGLRTLVAATQAAVDGAVLAHRM